jgi:uncharacterized flavoprotein (TIGR03862 family)
MAGEVLLGLGHKVTLYDAMPSIGRKFLMAGRGGLNLTHSEPLTDFMPRYGLATQWLAPMIEAFGPEDLRAWVEDLGQETFVGSSGRVFPKAMKASPLLRAWLARLAGAGLVFERGTRWQGWDEAGDLMFARSDGSLFYVKSKATLLAMGGASWAKLGSDGAWAGLLRNKGVDVAPLLPTNCGVQIGWSALMAERFAGIPVKAIAASADGLTARGDVMVTATGLEGGPIYALTRAIREALSSGAGEITLDLRPDTDTISLANRLVKAKQGQSLSSALKSQARLSPVAIGLMREACGNKLPTSAMGLAKLIKAVRLPVTGFASIDRAISTAGGIQQSALTSDLMLKVLPGVFVAGEMLDWEAPTGGYLLQACFASGRFGAYGMHNWIHAQT